MVERHLCKRKQCAGTCEPGRQWCEVHEKTLRPAVRAKKRCEHNGCYNISRAGVWCMKHGVMYGAVEMMSDEMKCEHGRCDSRALFGTHKKKRWCEHHACLYGGTLIRCRVNQCEVADCTRTRCYGVPGAKKIRWCRAHAKPFGGVCLKRRRCQHQGCDLTAFYGIRTRRWCASHGKQHGAHNLNTRVVCRTLGCAKIARHGESGKLLWCPDHDTTFPSNICGVAKCVKVATYGDEGSGTHRWCVRHGKARGAVFLDKHKHLVITI